MMKKILIFLFSILSFPSFSQINDDFESGIIDSWTENHSGRWTPSTINPIEGLYSLHHSFDNINGDHDQIATYFGSYDINTETTTWRFKVKHTYTPSSSNNWACILFSDKDVFRMHPDSSFNGYVIGVNFTGLDDIIKLWKISGTEKTEIINTGINWESEVGTSATAAFEIKRTVEGEFSVYFGITGSYDQLSQIGLSTIDAEHTTTSFFGFHYEYSSAQDMKLWFDDVYIGPEILDTEPPVILSVEASSFNKLIVNFNENISKTSSENINNFFVDGGIGYPESATRNASDLKQVELQFSTSFNDHQYYNLTTQNIEDESGNELINEQSIFNYFRIAPINIFTVSSSQIDVLFNKNVGSSLSENFFVNNEIGNPISSDIDITDNKRVHLFFTDQFIQDHPYTITVQNIQDIFGNNIIDTIITFAHHTAIPYDVVINEIMCDINPLPDPYLPPAKYLEIYNTSNFDIFLSEWTLKIGDNPDKQFPEKLIPSRQYAIICEDEFKSMFSSFGITLPILNSSELTTTGKRILIRNKNGTIIEDLTYSKSWYDDDEKDNGGWSLERIDSDNYCGEDDNWTAYDNNQLNYGGTPGSVNSTDRENLDNEYPELIDIKVVASNYLILIFNENISYESAENITNFFVNKDINNPSESYIINAEKKEIHLKFANQFQDNQEYTLTVEGIEDNCKNSCPEFSTDFVYNRIKPENIIVLNDKNIKITFSETVHAVSGTDENNYNCNNDIGHPVLAIRENADTSIVYLQFQTGFPDGIKCLLDISNITDINGNTMVTAQIPFTYHFPEQNDLIINEVLFNPYPEGSDFIEIYNNSDFDIDLSNIQIAGREKSYPYNFNSISTLSEEHLILKPKEYMAFTTSKYAVQFFYMSYNEQHIIEAESLPACNDDSGRIVLLHDNQYILDEFAYNDDMHLKLIKNTEGVSLERVNPDRQTQDPSNWHSASEMVGFATPAYQNSQYFVTDDFTDDPVYIDPYIFSPDNDGMDDYTYICYTFNHPGYAATIYIFDSEGRIVKQLANNIILDTKGSISWDGLYADHRTAPSGTYVVWFRVNDLEGNVRIFKKAVVLAKKY